MTFCCYGSHLPGIPGSIDKTREPYGRGGPMLPNAGLCRYSARIMREPEFLLTLETSAIVLHSIQQTCSFRSGALLAAHVRTNHVHAVVDAISSSSAALHDLKVYATSALAAADGQIGLAAVGSSRQHRTVNKARGC